MRLGNAYVLEVFSSKIQYMYHVPVIETIISVAEVQLFRVREVNLNLGKLQ